MVALLPVILLVAPLVSVDDPDHICRGFIVGGRGEPNLGLVVTRHIEDVFSSGRGFEPPLEGFSVMGQRSVGVACVFIGNQLDF